VKETHKHEKNVVKIAKSQICLRDGENCFSYILLLFTSFFYTGRAFCLDTILLSPDCWCGQMHSLAPDLLCELKQRHINTVKG